MERREFLRNFSTYLTATAATCSSCGAAFGGMFPGQNTGNGGSDNSMFPKRETLAPATEESVASRKDVPNLALQGCTLNANEGSAFGLNGIRLLRSSGRQDVDQATFEEQRFLSGYIGNYRPSVAFLEDSQGKNAAAFPRDVTGWGSPHGAVLLGVFLIHDLLNRPGARTELSNGWSIAAIMAHEWAHISQFANGVRPHDRRVVGMELMADAISGWYLAKKLQFLGQTIGPELVRNSGASDQSAAARAMYSMGDTNFTDPNHHGTHEQRLHAFLSGHNMGMEGGTFEHIFQFGRKRYVPH